MNGRIRRNHTRDPFQDPKTVQRALAAGVREALLRHKRLGLSVVESRDGQIVWIPPEEIPVSP